MNNWKESGQKATSADTWRFTDPSIDIQWLICLIPLQASRAQILKKTTECIQTLRRKISENQKDIEEIKKQNSILDEQSKLSAEILIETRLTGFKSFP